MLNSVGPGLMVSMVRFVSLAEAMEEPLGVTPG